MFDVLTGTRTAIVTPATGNVGSFGWASPTQLVLRANLANAGYRLHSCTTTGSCTQLAGPASNATVEAMVVSPDGSFVIYSANERGAQYDLYKVASTGGTPLRLAPDAPQGWRVSIDPIISPNGQWVAVLTSSGLINVLATNATNTSLDPQYSVVMPVAAFNFTFSGDSSAFGFRADIAVDGKYDVYRLTSFFNANQTPALVQSANGGSVTEFTWR